jgi:hypothetical protein
MKIYLIDGHPLETKEKPDLDGLNTRMTDQPGERIMGISVQRGVSLAVESGEKNYLLPIYFHGFRSLNREKK